MNPDRRGRSLGMRRSVRLTMAMTGMDKLERMRESAEQLKCPFLRRRAVDFADAVKVVADWVASRHKRLDIRPFLQTGELKRTKLSTEQVFEILRDDFLVNKYYITGALTSQIYRDDCFFDSPDPDLPIRDLKKYRDAASNLFNRRLSRCDLLSIEIVEDKLIVAEWRLEGVLRLPWKPSVKAFLGKTKFFLDGDGLVRRHEEQWSITVFDAFISTLLLKDFGAPGAPPVEVVADPQFKRVYL
ncbi:hypothetical protein NDN08_005243 [Rhodosorus marinus]|uniref:SnoaL-like domain-containing protein n=1 Tax=Rhodosorus marinus TaxID=101924 RepID=A0AAV8V3Z7_9RHOD|nr:hypothetical protein NDN08_005243 [Rhodosorus marinus]